MRSVTRRNSRLAQRLADMWNKENMVEFHSLVDEMIESNDDDTLLNALSIVRANQGGEQANDMWVSIMSTAEMCSFSARNKPFLDADIFVIPLLCNPESKAPAPQKFHLDLGLSGMFPDNSRIVLTKAWCTLEEITSLSPCAVRRTLVSIIEDRPIDDLDFNGVPTSNEGAVLVGICINEPNSSNFNETSCILDDDDDDMDIVYNTWRERVLDMDSNLPKGSLVIDIMRPSSPSGLSVTVENHMDEISSEQEQDMNQIDMDEIMMTNTGSRTLH